MRAEIFKGQDGQWYVRLKAGNGRTMSVSEGYSNKANAERAAQRMFPNYPIYIMEP